MNSYQRVRAFSARLSHLLIAPLCTAVLVFSLMAGSAHAQTASTGTVTGRVINTDNGQYLGNARVTVANSSIEALTNEFGEYELRNVPVGTANITVAYTGQEPKTSSVVVTADKVATQDFRLGGKTNENGALVLDAYTVESNRFKTGQELAINEERRSINLKDVVSSDTFGHIPGGNIGEFVKYLPGVIAEYGDADAFGGAGIGGVNQSTASQVAVRGFGAADTPITIDGMPLAGISPAGLTRAIGLDMLSINNTSRIEIIKVARPDMPNDAPGGTINLVTKSAFEYARPRTSVTLLTTFNTEETSFFKKSPGPANEKTYHTLPGGTASVIYPLSSTMGFAASISSANSFSPNHQISNTWFSTTTTNTRIPTNNPTPTTTVVDAKGRQSDITNPFLRQTSVVDNPWNDFKQSGSFRFDWRPLNDLTLNTSFTLSQYTGINVSRRLQFSAEKPMDWGPTYVIGRPFEAATTTPAVAALDPGNKGAMTVTARDRSGFSMQGYIKADYHHGPWTVGASASKSEAYGAFKDLKNNHFAEINLTLANVGQVIMTDINDGIPGSVKVIDRTGAVLDYSNLNNWTIDNAATLDVKTQKSFQRDKAGTYNLDVTRDLDFLPFSLTAKIGVAQSVKEQRKWGIGTGGKMRYTGPTLTTAGILDTTYIVPPGFSYSQPQQWGDNYKIYDIYAAHPEFFNPDFDVSYSIANYRTTITQNKSVKETSNAGYAMLEGHFLRNRLNVIAGVRQSRSDIKGHQAFTDSKWNYVKNPDGTLYKDSTYKVGLKYDGSNNLFDIGSATVARDIIFTDTALQTRLKAAGAIYPDHLILGAAGVNGTTANSLEATKLNLYTRKVDASRTNPVTPSISATYNITENLKASLGWSRETRLPALDSGNGTSSSAAILGGYQINQNTSPTVGPGSDGAINVSNPGLMPEISNSYNVQLAYYTKNGGSISANYYYKLIKNRWETNDLFNSTPEYFETLSTLGLDPADFVDWKITTTYNGIENSKATGYELSARQNFSFLGEIGSHFYGFANYSHKESTPSAKAGVVSLFISSNDTWNAGLNYHIGAFGITAKMTSRGKTYNKSGTVNLTTAGNTVTYQLYDYTPKETKLDVDLDYQLSKRYALFVSAQNILNSERQKQRLDAGNILPSYAYVTSNYKFGVQVTVGVTGSF